MVVAQRPHHGGAGVRPEGHHGHAEAGAEVGEPVEQLGRLDPFDDDRDRVPAVGHPSPGPLPAAEVRQGDDDTLALREAVDDVILVADLTEARRRPLAGSDWGSRKLSSQ